MHFCVIAHGVPLFARVLLGQTASGGNSGWCLLRCPSACRPHSNLAFNAKAVLAQLTTSSVASCATAFLLLRAGRTATSLSPEAATGPSSDEALASDGAWLHTLLVLLSALAAAVCDTVRSVRRGEHDLQFPIVAADPEPLAALSAFWRGTLPRLVQGATKSAVEWLLACAGVALVVLPFFAQCLLFVGQRVIGGGASADDAVAGTSPVWLTAIDDVASRPWQTCAPPLSVVMRAGICYACNYLLLQHGPTLLAKVLTTPLDFNRAAGYPPGDVSGATATVNGGFGSGAPAAVMGDAGQPGDMSNRSGSGGNGSFYGGGGAGGPDEQFTGFRSGSTHGEFSVLASDGVTPAAKLLVDTLSLGWQRALQDPDQRLALDQEGPMGNGLGGLRAAGTSSSSSGGGGNGSGLGALSSGGPGDNGTRAELDWVKVRLNQCSRRLRLNVQ